MRANRIGVFEIVLALVLILTALGTVGAQDFGNHIVAERIGVSHVDASAEMRAVLRSAGM